LVAGSVTAGGDHPSLLVTATSPPTARVVRSFPDIYPDGQVRLSGTIANDPDITGTGGLYWGNVVIGSTNYASAYYLTEAGEVDRSRVYLTRVGGGWGDATFFDTTRYWNYPDPRSSPRSTRCAATGRSPGGTGPPGGTSRPRPASQRSRRWR
jgi:hypothetical protein